MPARQMRHGEIKLTTLWTERTSGVAKPASKR